MPKLVVFPTHFFPEQVRDSKINWTPSEKKVILIAKNWQPKTYCSSGISIPQKISPSQCDRYNIGRFYSYWKNS